MGRIALFGGGGVIGQSIANALRAKGESYRVVGRSRKSLEGEFGDDPLAEIVTWNPEDPDSVRTAARGVYTLIYLIGVPYNNLQLHSVLMRKTLDRAIAEKVAQIV